MCQTSSVTHGNRFSNIVLSGQLGPVANPQSPLLPLQPPSHASPACFLRAWQPVKLWLGVAVASKCGSTTTRQSLPTDPGLLINLIGYSKSHCMLFQ